MKHRSLVGRQKSSRVFIGSLVAILAGVVFYFSFFPSQAVETLFTLRYVSSQFVSVILSHNFRSIAEIQSHYTQASYNNSAQKVRILLVPGHEPEYGGAEFADVKERNLTVELAQHLQKFLNDDSHYSVFVTRDTQNWTPEFANYFDSQWNDIKLWQKLSHQESTNLVSIQSTPPTTGKVFHNTAPADIAYRLYGITKWANENTIDIVIHIHFNDYPGHKTSRAGMYSGFAIYVPASQYGNSNTTKAIAANIFKRLAQYYPVSNLPGESDGIVDEPELIAIGSNNTSDAASMLIEYSYIYEAKLQDPSSRRSTLKNMAFQTYLGLQDFFAQK